MLGIIMLLAMVFDISDRLGEFIENKAPLTSIIFSYYWNFILYYGNMFSPMIIFLSVIWFTAKLAQDSEIIPMLNSGKPFTRILRPYLISATLLAIISLVLNHFVIPNANKTRLEFEEHFYRNAFSMDNYFAEYPGGEVVYFSSYTAEDGGINEFVLENWDERDSLTYFLKARKAMNIAGTNKWVLTDYYERKTGYPDDVWLRSGHEKDTVFDFKVDEMATRDNIADAMTYGELRRFIRRERQKGSPKIPLYELVLYRRTSFPFATYILTIIGFSVSSRKKRGGIGVNIAIGLGIIFVYIFAMQVTDVAAQNVGFPPLIAVWIPNVIFAGIAFILYKFAKR